MKWRLLFVAGILAALLETSTAIAPAADYCSSGGQDNEPKAGSKEYVRQALSKTVSIDVTDRPLDEVVNALAEQAKVPVMFHRKSLEQVGLDASAEKVTASLKDLPLRSCLRAVLREAEVTYMIEEGFLLITTPEHAESELLTVVLDVSDLIGVEEGLGFDEADYDTLIELIATTVAPNTWDSVGGPGSFTSFRGTIVFHHTEEVIDQVCQFLAAIREAKQIVAEHGDSPPPVTSVYAERHPQRHKQIQTALDSKAEFEFKNTALKDIVDFLSSKYQIPIHLDKGPLKQRKISAETKLTWSAKHGTLRRALQSWLDDFDLAYFVYGGVLFLSTPDAAENHQSIRIYPVKDLVELIPAASLDWRLMQATDVDILMDYDSLIELTTTVTWPWWGTSRFDDALAAFSAYGLLIVKQSERAHQEIERLYSGLRKAIPAAAKKPPKLPRCDDIRTAVYRIGSPAGQEPHDNTPSERELVELITSLIESESWRKRDDVYARAITGRLVIRHTNAVHREIQRLATKLELPGFYETPKIQEGYQPGHEWFPVVPPAQPTEVTLHGNWNYSAVIKSQTKGEFILPFSEMAFLPDGQLKVREMWIRTGVPDPRWHSEGSWKVVAKDDAGWVVVFVNMDGKSATTKVRIRDEQFHVVGLFTAQIVTYRRGATAKSSN